MSMPKGLVDQVKHVFESSRQREVLINLASRVEALELIGKPVSPFPCLAVTDNAEATETVEPAKKEVFAVRTRNKS